MVFSRPIESGQNPFHSFWMGGFECSDKLNVSGHRVDLLKETGHLRFLSEDYRRLKELGIRTVREGIRWSQVEKHPFNYDWSTVMNMARVAQENDIQVIWDLCHFGFPDDLSPLHPAFARRFAALCSDFALQYRSRFPLTPIFVTPINEISFLSWLGGEAGCTVPYCRRQGWDVKYNLVKAFIQGVRAMKEIDDNLFVLSSEPLLNVVPPRYATDQQIADAAVVHEEQYQSNDMLLGKCCPELGGSAEIVDVMGFNFYYSNQWQADTRQLIGWANIPHDPRWRPFSALLEEAYRRYGLPVILSETSHPGEHRPQWINYITEEVEQLLLRKIPFLGICIYPVLDRPDWDRLDEWHESGLWQVDRKDGYWRVPNAPYADALRLCMERLEKTIHASSELWHSRQPAFSS